MDANMETPPETPQIGRGRSEGSRATQFQPGHPGRAKGVGRTPRSVPRLLRDMRAVYAQDESKDRTPGQRRCREWLKADPKGFLSKMADLEKADSTAGGKGKERGDPADPEPDEGRERAEAACERLLEAWASQKENGRDGRCSACGRPTAGLATQ